MSVRRQGWLGYVEIKVVSLLLSGSKSVLILLRETAREKRGVRPASSLAHPHIHGRRRRLPSVTAFNIKGGMRAKPVALLGLASESLGFVVAWLPVLPRRTVSLWSKKPEVSSGDEAFGISEPCNVVLTTTNADFDSLAAACALAELWSVLEPFKNVPTHVVLPRGALPSVSRFLSYHKHVLPVRGFKTIDADDVQAVGVVDASSASRLGRASKWLEKARSVHVFDHHVGGTLDLESVATEYCLEPVGSTTTIMVERLRSARIVPGPAAATLYVLGIRADTGGLAYESTTLRDADALCWLLKCGASQAAVAEFSLDRVGVEQREALAAALPEVRSVTYRGIEIATVAVVTDRYVSGLGLIAEELLALTAADVLLLAAQVADEGKRSWIDVIGRARPSAVGVDLREVVAPLGGGGHARAAAASLSLRTDDSTAAETVLREARARVEAQIPVELRAARFMTTDVVAVPADATIANARCCLVDNDLKSVPIVDPDTRRLRGLLKLSDVVKAEKQRKDSDPVTGWMRTQVKVVSPRATLAQIEVLLQTTGRLPVCDDDKVLLGIVTRTDVLRIKNYYVHGIEKSVDATKLYGDDDHFHHTLASAKGALFDAKAADHPESGPTGSVSCP